MVAKPKIPAAKSYMQKPRRSPSGAAFKPITGREHTLSMLPWQCLSPSRQRPLSPLKVPQMFATAINFCPNCGVKTVLRVPEGDNLVRAICDGCNSIHYQNPKIVVGCIPEWEDKILICKRAIEPRYGLWTLPAGFMENNESVTEGAAPHKAPTELNRMSYLAGCPVPSATSVKLSVAPLAPVATALRLLTEPTAPTGGVDA